MASRDVGLRVSPREERVARRWARVERRNGRPGVRVWCAGESWLSLLRDRYALPCLSSVAHAEKNVRTVAPRLRSTSVGEAVHRALRRSRAGGIPN
jgi:hypothetical protein